MRNAVRFFLPVGGALLFAMTPLAQAAPPTYFTVNCSTAVHLTDHVSCAAGRTYFSGPGVYVPFSPKHFTQVTTSAYFYNFPPALPHWVVTSITATKANGSPALTDADLDPIDSTLAATVAAKQGPVFNIDPNIEESFIGSEDALIDSRAVSNAIGNTGLNPAAMAVGTVVMVQWSDGTTAQFVKVSNNTLMWSYVPGSAKNAKGQPIDSNGKVTGQNLNGVSLGLPAAALPNFSSIYLDPIDWMFWSPVPEITIGPIEQCGLGVCGG